MNEPGGSGVDAMLLGEPMMPAGGSLPGAVLHSVPPHPTTPPLLPSPSLPQLGMLLGGSMMAGGSSYRGQEPVLSANYAFDLGFQFSM